MSKQTEALKLALEALEYISSHYMSLPKIGCMALAAVEEALAEQPAQPQQEPVAWMIWTHGPVLVFMSKDEANMEFDRLNHAYPEPTRMLVPLYTSPPAQRKPWVGLTDAERETLRSEADEADAGYRELIKATEAKLRKKNS